MGEVYFYQLTRSPVEATLPVLIDKALGAGWRVLLRGTDRARMDWLDERLWLVPEEGFVPHGMAGGPHDADQPVLLTLDPGPGAPNGAMCLITLDGAPLTAAEVQAMARACVVFDGNDKAALELARDQWRNLTRAGVAAQYWSEETGRWQKKA